MFNLNIKTIKHLSFALHMQEKDMVNIAKDASKLYRKTYRIKPNGDKRPIHVPKAPLKKAQKNVSKLLKGIELPNSIHGYRNGRSTKSCAAVHIGKANLLKFDISNFFPSISSKMVYDLFVGSGCSPDVARCLTKLTTKNGCLPQGAPSSPIISNFFTKKIYSRLKPLEEKHHFSISFYSDDVGISSNGNRLKKYKNLIFKIFEQEGFKVAEEKTRYFDNASTKEIVGIQIGKDGVFVPKRIIAKIKQSIDGDLNNAIVLRGKINYVKNINKNQGKMLEKYYLRRSV